MKKQLFLAILALGLLSQTAHAQTDSFFDGDFSVNPGSGNPAPDGAYRYVHNSGTTTDVGGTGGWTFINGSSAGNSAIYLVDTTTAYSEAWIPQAAPSNTNGYVVQLDTISTPGSWNTGNAITQTVSVDVGQQYSLTFSINTEQSNGSFNKAQLSLADIIVTNATIDNSTGSVGTISASAPNNLNAAAYGDGTALAYQYAVDTTLSPDGGDASTWATYTLTFTATSSTIQLALADDPGATNNSNSNIALESISLTAVPEPREWAVIMLLGVAGLVIARKTRARVLCRQSAA